MAKRDTPATLMPGQIEGKTDNSIRRRLGYDSQALDHARNHDVLQARVQTLRVLADDHQIDVPIRHHDARQRSHRPHAGEKIQLLAQANIDRAKPLAHGRSARSLESDAMTAYQVERV